MDLFHNINQVPIMCLALFQKLEWTKLHLSLMKFTFLERSNEKGDKMGMGKI